MEGAQKNRGPTAEAASGNLCLGGGCLPANRHVAARARVQCRKHLDEREIEGDSRPNEGGVIPSLVWASIPAVAVLSYRTNHRSRLRVSQIVTIFLPVPVVLVGQGESVSLAITHSM